MIPRERLTGQNRGGDGRGRGQEPFPLALSSSLSFSFAFNMTVAINVLLSCRFFPLPFFCVGLLFIGLVSRCSVEA